VRLDVHGDRAAISVDGQPPLVVPQLAHSVPVGSVGLWTYLPAYFSNLRISSRAQPLQDCPDPGNASDVVSEWFIQGLGWLKCEPSGVLNLNRQVPTTLEQVHLQRRFELTSRHPVELHFGFSDELVLAVDGLEVFAGTNSFKGFGGYEERGYAHLGAHSLSLMLHPGLHTLDASLKVTEAFGWGIILALRGSGVRTLPAEGS
jgi:hypothetical protein